MARNSRLGCQGPRDDCPGGGTGAAGRYPEFFRRAEVELGYLCPEPDRWRLEDREPALRGLADRDHVVQLEGISGPLPRNSYEFLLQYAGKSKPSGGTLTYGEVGFAPYAIGRALGDAGRQLHALAQGAERSEHERRIRRQIEQNIIHIAGLLSHFVTDTGQPPHTIARQRLEP